MEKGCSEETALILTMQSKLLGDYLIKSSGFQTPEPKSRTRREKSSRYVIIEAPLFLPTTTAHI